MGAVDFAGGAVVHITCGVSALVGCLILGSRKTPHEENKPHNIPLMMVGAAMLWFGWFGFNGGSALESTDGLAAVAILNVSATLLGEHGLLACSPASLFLVPVVQYCCWHGLLHLGVP